MTCILRRRRGGEDTEIQGRWQHEDRSRDWSPTSTNQEHQGWPVITRAKRGMEQIISQSL